MKQLVKMFLMLAALGGTLVAIGDADVLVWQVDLDSRTSPSIGEGGLATFDAINFTIGDTGINLAEYTYLNINALRNGTPNAAGGTDYITKGIEFDEVAGSSYTSWYYTDLRELLGDNRISGTDQLNMGLLSGGVTLNWLNEDLTLNDMADYLYDYDQLTALVNPPDVTSIKDFGGSMTTPEPTSGLLLMVGGALLALRRRRA